MDQEFELSQLSSIAKQILAEAGQQKIFLFDGEMGAGKTTLIKAICAQLGVTGLVSSPTFALVNEYVYPEGLIYHFDAYRLKNPVEALDMGFEEYLSSGHYCFIEWSEKIEALWPQQYVRISLSPIDSQTRKISLSITA